MKKIFFIIGLFFIMVSNVFAEEINLIKERIYDSYTYYYDISMSRYRYLYANKYIFGNNIAYCLELGKSIDSSIYNFTTSFEELAIPKDIINDIKIISYYGYDYPNHQNDNYYMATQSLIWAKLSNSSVSWIRNIDSSNIIDISSEKDEIMSLVQNHYKKPSFDNGEVTLISGENKIITDNNNILSEYTTDNDKVKIEENNLIIDGSIKDKEIVLTKKGYSNKVFFVYSSGNSQKMLSSGMVDNIESKIKIKLITGSITIEKLDKENNSITPSGDASLNGAIYSLFDSNGNLVDDFIVGKKNKISNLSLGKYYLKEKESGLGYLLDENTYEIEINVNNLDTIVNVYDEVIKRKVDIFKVFASDKTGLLVGEKNIVFEIYNKNNVLVDSVITDSDGYASIVLPYGTYIVRQINSTENYYKVDDFIIQIDKVDERPIYKLLSNSERMSKIKVIKKDADTDDNIINSNIKFKIFDVNNNKFITYQSVYPDKKTIDEFLIGDDGTFISPMELSSGNYILYEVDDDMDGYLYNKEGIKFSIGDNSNFINDSDYGIIMEVPFYNKRVKGNIKIIKYGEKAVYEDNSYRYEKILLSDVKFNIYAFNDIYENEKLIYHQGDLIEEIITDKNGMAELTNLPLGIYKAIEISSSGGNSVNSSEYKIELNYKDQYTKIISYELVVNNNLPKGKLIINKYDSSSNLRIPNTLIEVRSFDNRIVYKGYTDINGQINIKDLPYGKYYLSEIEASTGYRLLEDKIYFEIDKKDTEIDIYNERLEIPNTGININFSHILFAGFFIIGFSLLVFYRKFIFMKIFSILFLAISACYYGIYFYKYYDDLSNNKRSVTAYLEHKENTFHDDRYSYMAVIDIPSIMLKRGFLNTDNKYNDVKYNIELISYNDNSILLAAHNGNNYNSYFENLSKMELGDIINIYYNGKLYKYIYSDNYEVEKNGYVSLYKNENKKSIILVTCKDGSNDSQVVYIGYLKEILDY